MRLLLDANIARAVAELLSERGHDVLWVRTLMPEASDVDVLEFASSEKRILITHDKGFGALVFTTRLRLPPAIVLLRVSPVQPDALARFVARALEEREEWAGSFWTIDERRLRAKRLPPRRHARARDGRRE